MPKKSKSSTIKITLVKSPIGYSKRHKATVKALGLRRINQSVEHQDVPTTRGMVALISHLVRVEEQVEK
jgi:large subunit ribosomal protein L30